MLFPINKDASPTIKGISPTLKDVSPLIKDDFQMNKAVSPIFQGGLTVDLKSPAGNFALLQWRVVDIAGQCNLISIARRTRQTSSDKSATASNADR
jgi:hypothetical protein